MGRDAPLTRSRGLPRYGADHPQLSIVSLQPNVTVTATLQLRMSNSPETSGSDLVKNSSLYREFQAEREEIMRHKWIESEKAGYDIGFERALTDWIIKHRAKWRRARQQQTAAVQH